MQNISAQTAAELIEKNRDNSNFVILDVRTPGEFQVGHIGGAELLDIYGDFENEVAKLPRDKTYLVYCRSGHRSVSACEMMEELGFTHCLNLAGGIIEWSETGLPISQSVN